MGSTRLKGDALSMLIDGKDYWADATSVVMDCDRLEVPLFEGGMEIIPMGWWFDVTAVQSTGEGSFWLFLWEHQGETVPFAYAPHGNEVPTVDEPHFTGILNVSSPAALGGAAGRRVEQVFTTRLHIVQGPYRVTTT